MNLLWKILDGLELTMEKEGADLAD